MLKTKDIVVRYGGAEALKGISIEVGRGEITTLIGANGAGKSTCLRAISGLVPLSSGEIWFEGERIDGMAPEKIVKLGVAHIPEERRLFPWMNVFDNLMTGAFLRKDREAVRQDVEKAFAYFPILRERQAQQARSLSGGEQQMLAIGRGLLSDPKCFLFDEPSLGLAPRLVKEVGDCVRQLAEEGYAVVLVEQNARLALTIAKRAYVLEIGKVALEGDADQLKDDGHVKTAYLGL